MKKVFFVFVMLILPIVVSAHEVGNDFEKTQIKECTPVVITDEGFVPKLLEITKGSCVTWENVGELGHWPASNFHPTHQEYPSKEQGCLGSSLDACRSLESGESYTFTFQESGSWGMHDHVFPGLTMRVEVQGQEGIWERFQKGFSVVWESIKDWILGFFTKQDNSSVGGEFRKALYEEQERIIADLAKKDPEEAWNYLKKVSMVQGQVVINVHEFAHSIGNEAYAQLGFDGVFLCDDTFAYGCFHGVTEELLRKEGPSIISEVEKTCIKVFPPEKNLDYTGCIHGTGHGLLSWSGLHVQEALEYCDTFSKEFRNYCYDGVFMEYSFSATKDSIDKNNPWEFCIQLSSQYHYNCARYQNQLFMQVLHWDIVATATACSKAPLKELRETCTTDFGYMATQIHSKNLQEVRNTCALFLEQEDRYHCFIGAATEFVFQEYQDWQDNSWALCNELPDFWKEECFATREQTIHSYQRQEL
jgi:plastocyanin